jgi:phosphatidylinositol glycan class A protein
MLSTTDPEAFHSQVKSMYSWHDVAMRSEIVYHRVIATPSLALLTRLQRYYECGMWAGKLMCLSIMLDLLLFNVLEWLQPRHSIDIAPDAARDAPVKAKGAVQSLSKDRHCHASECT